MGDISEKHLLALGRITVYFSELEHLIARSIGSVLGIDARYEEAITSELSFRSRLCILSSLFKLKYVEDKYPKYTAKFKELVGLAFKVEERRNSIIHSLWAGEGEIATRIKVTAKAKRGRQITDESFNAEALNDIASDMRDIGLQINILISETDPNQFG